jgi:hypothetical protein
LHLKIWKRGEVDESERCFLKKKFCATRTAAALRLFNVFFKSAALLRKGPVLKNARFFLQYLWLAATAPATAAAIRKIINN